MVPASQWVSSSYISSDTDTQYSSTGFVKSLSPWACWASVFAGGGASSCSMLNPEAEWSPGWPGEEGDAAGLVTCICGGEVKGGEDVSKVIKGISGGGSDVVLGVCDVGSGYLHGFGVIIDSAAVTEPGDFGGRVSKSLVLCGRGGGLSTSAPVSLLASNSARVWAFFTARCETGIGLLYMGKVWAKIGEGTVLLFFPPLLGNTSVVFDSSSSSPSFTALVRILTARKTLVPSSTFKVNSPSPLQHFLPASNENVVLLRP